MPSLIGTIATTVSELATPDMKRKALIAEVREKHPKASKGDIVRPAFLAVISNADGDPTKADRLQAAAISERSSDDDDRNPKKTRKTKKAR